MRKVLTPLILILNLIIFGYHLTKGIYDYFTIETYRKLGLIYDIESAFFFITMSLAGVFAFIGLLKVRWAILISTLSAVSLLAAFTYWLVGHYFDPMEQGRNGGMIPMIVIVAILLIANFGVFVWSLKTRTTA